MISSHRNYKRQYLDKDDIQFILDSEPEGDDMTEQAPVPPSQELYKRGQLTDQSAGGVDNNTDGSYETEMIPTPLAPQGVSKWE
jgi:hypothetical protein